VTLHFEWEDEKAKRNQQKHLVRFDDPQFITFLDEEHSSDEE
jgi:uncharacterized DUF497 family protein